MDLTSFERSANLRKLERKIAEIENRIVKSVLKTYVEDESKLTAELRELVEELQNGGK